VRTLNDHWLVASAEILMENTTDRSTDSFALPRPDAATDHIRGSASAPVTVIEYGDFESPSCGHARIGLKILLDHFGDRVRFVFRHYPEIEIHPHAERAAEAAEAAGAQGRFWPYYGVLFEHQEYLSERDLRQYAAQVGLDLERYDNEMNDRLYRQRVQQHAMDGRKLGIRAMPTFFVNGKLTDVSFGLRHLEDAVDRELRMIDSA
jgi:protein-disulfide isomerase